MVGRNTVGITTAKSAGFCNEAIWLPCSPFRNGAEKGWVGSPGAGSIKSLKGRQISSWCVLLERRTNLTSNRRKIRFEVSTRSDLQLNCWLHRKSLTPTWRPHKPPRPRRCRFRHPRIVYERAHDKIG